MSKYFIVTAWNVSFIFGDKFYEKFEMNDVIAKGNYRVKDESIRYDLRWFDESWFDGLVF